MTRDEHRLTPRRPSWPWIAIAAALLIVFTGVLVMLTRMTRRTPPPPTATVVTTTTAAPPQRPPHPPPDPVAGLDPALQSIAVALLEGRLPSAALLAELRLPERDAEPREGELAIVEPEGIVVADDQPLFQWRGGTAPFRVEIFDEKSEPIATSGAIRKYDWRPEKPLPRSRVLTWQVRRENDGAGKPAARFRVASAAALDRAANARSPLEAALIYAGEGLLDDARSKLAEAPQNEETRRMIETLGRAP